MYDTYVVLPESPDAWKQEFIGSLENYGFPRAAAWGGFRVYFVTKLKNHYSFKKRYLISNMGLVSYNQRFLAASVYAPVSTLDARLFWHTSIFKDILGGRVLLDKTINLVEEYG